MFNIKKLLAVLLMCVGTGMAAPSEDIQKLYDEMRCLGEKLGIALPESPEKGSDVNLMDVHLMHEITNSKLMENATYKAIGEHTEPEVIERVDDCYGACLKIMTNFDDIIKHSLSRQTSEYKKYIAGAIRFQLRNYELPKKSNVVSENYNHIRGFVKLLDVILQECKFFEAHLIEMDGYKAKACMDGLELVLRRTLKDL